MGKRKSAQLLVLPHNEGSVAYVEPVDERINSNKSDFLFYAEMYYHGALSFSHVKSNSSSDHGIKKIY